MSCKNPDNQNREKAPVKNTEVIKDWFLFFGELAKASVEGVVEFFGKEKPVDCAPVEVVQTPEVVVAAPVEETLEIVEEPREAIEESVTPTAKELMQQAKAQAKEEKRAKKAAKREAKLLKKQERAQKRAEKKQAKQLKKEEKKQAKQLKAEEKKQADLLKKKEQDQNDLQKKEEKAEKKQVKKEPVEENDTDDKAKLKAKKRKAKLKEKKAKQKAKLKEQKAKQKAEQKIRKEENRPRTFGAYVAKSRILSTQEKVFARALRRAAGPLHVVKIRVPMKSVLRYRDGSRCKCDRLGDMDFGVFDLGNRLRVLIQVKGMKRQNKQSPAKYCKVRRLCKKVGIPVVTFRIKGDVSADYIRERIREYLRLL